VGGANFSKSVVHLNYNFVNARVFGKPVQCLVDTGAGKNCVSEQFLNVLHKKMNPLQSGDLLSLLAADGRTVKVSGKINLPLQIGGMTLNIDFCVLPNLNQQIVLGMEMLHDTHAQLNFADGYMTLFDDPTAVKLISAVPNDNLALLTKQIRLKPMTETLVPVRLSRPYTGLDETVMLEQLAPIESQKYGVARVLVKLKPRESATAIKIINPTNKLIKLPKNTAVAKLEAVEQKRIDDK
jgi:predicted aspartyl protease